jgi:hypothetical protein
MLLVCLGVVVSRCDGVVFLGVRSAMSQSGAWAMGVVSGWFSVSHVYGLPLGCRVGGARTCPPSPRMSMPAPSFFPASFLTGSGDVK